MSKKAIEAKANEERWKQWKRESRVQEQQPRALSTTASDVKHEAEAIDVAGDSAGDGSAVPRAPDAPARPSRAATARSTVHAAPDASRTARASEAMSIQRALRAATARAALSRLDTAAQTADVVAAFKQAGAANEGRGSDDAADDDDEELEPTTTVYCDACNKARVLSADEAALADVDADSWTCANLARTQRDASCDAVDDEVAQIAGAKIALLLQKAGVHTRKELADTTPAKVLKHLVDPLEMSNVTLKEQLASMIDEARLDEVNDWMSEIVGDANLVGLLELQKLGTPADLVTTPLDLVYDAVQGDEHDDVSVERVQTWREQARELVAQHAWLADWRTI